MFGNAVKRVYVGIALGSKISRLCFSFPKNWIDLAMKREIYIVLEGVGLARFHIFNFAVAKS